MVALGSAIDRTTSITYSSALQSYLTFCRSHSFPINPTPDTLSFYTVYMSHHIKPSLVDSYLSGICNQLEPFYPDVREVHHHRLVTRTLRGCKKIRAVATIRKRPLRRAELAALAPIYTNSSTHNDLLFFAILLVGFFALMRLGELVWPDRVELQDPRKLSMCHSVEILPNGISFFLPGHKADRFLEGNHIIVQETTTPDDPVAPFKSYLVSRDKLFPFHPHLWLRANGTIPTRNWFLCRLKTHFKDNVSRHSLRAGGATALAEAGIPAHIIQAIGHWTSNTFQIYIRQHPVLLAALIHDKHPN
ncbi:hypothetical protein HWV62_17670 [Athelia sp. TMB]|nr:hypothetical protein HWV62_17670 [Athelia sp. TMB]